LAIDDDAWNGNVRALTELLTATPWDSAPAADLNEAAGRRVAVANALARELIAAVTAEPLSYEPRLRASALIEALSDAPLRLISRLTGESVAASSAPDLADALRVLAEGSRNAEIADTRTFDDAMDRILDLAAAQITPCIPAVVALGDDLVPLLTSAMAGSAPSAAPVAGEGGAAGGRLDVVVETFQHATRAMVVSFTGHAFAALSKDVAATVETFTRGLPEDASVGAVRHRVRMSLADGRLHAAAASRRHDPWRLGRAVKGLERDGRWAGPAAAVEGWRAQGAFVSEAGVAASQSVVAGLGVAWIIWAARDHLGSFQLDSLPRVHEPSML